MFGIFIGSAKKQYDKLHKDFEKLQKEYDKKLEESKSVSDLANTFGNVIRTSGIGFKQQSINNSIICPSFISIIVPPIHETQIAFKCVADFQEFQEMVASYQPFYAAAFNGDGNIDVFCTTFDENLALMLKLKYC
jgi:hypothetical protein